MTGKCHHCHDKILSATDKHFAFRKFRTGAKDRLTFKISHFAVQILPVDIQTKVRKIQELLENSDFWKIIYSFIARHCAENFDARLDGTVI